jgi:hypothetical protein
MGKYLLAVALGVGFCWFGPLKTKRWRASRDRRP